MSHIRLKSQNKSNLKQKDWLSEDGKLSRLAQEEVIIKMTTGACIGRIKHIDFAQEEADKMERNSDELTEDCQQDDGVSVSILYSELLHQIMG